MITLHTAPAAFGVTCASPFAVKADILLQMAGVPFERVVGRPDKGPRGKLPWIVDGDTTVADTTLIRRHLEQRHGADFERGMDDDERARAVLMCHTVEHLLYFAQVRFRWEDHPAAVRDGFFSEVPGPFRGFVFGMVRRNVVRALDGHGIGRYARDELLAITGPAWDAIAHELGDGPFLFGGEPTFADATVYGLVSNVLTPDVPLPLADQIRAHSNLMAWIDRMTERFPIPPAR